MNQLREVKVFCATMARDREGLGEKVTKWIKQHDAKILEVVVRQSSDAEFHCLSIILFCA